MALGMEVGLGLGHVVLDVPAPRPLQKRTELPQFYANFYCGQAAGCIKILLGTEPSAQLTLC